MKLDICTVNAINKLFVGGPAYLAITGKAGRDTTETIERYLEDISLVADGPLNDYGVFVAIVPRGSAQFFVDRLASGLICATVHETLREAADTAAERYWEAKR